MTTDADMVRCALCERFSMRGTPRMAAVDMGLCSAERSLRPGLPESAYGSISHSSMRLRECRLFVEAKKIDERRAYVKSHEKQHLKNKS